MNYAPAGQGGHCIGEFRLAVGETYVVLRDEHGRPYFDGPLEQPEGGLPIDAQIGEAERRVRFNAPALVRVVGPDDLYLVRLRAALSGAP
jgi:hypothetical protein